MFMGRNAYAEEIVACAPPFTAEVGSPSTPVAAAPLAVTATVAKAALCNSAAVGNLAAPRAHNAAASK